MSGPECPFSKPELQPTTTYSTVFGLMTPEGSPDCLTNKQNGCLDPNAINFLCQGESNCEDPNASPGTPSVNLPTLCMYPTPSPSRTPIKSGDAFTIFAYNLTKGTDIGDYSFLASKPGGGTNGSGVITINNVSVPIQNNGVLENGAQLLWTMNRDNCNLPEQTTGRTEFGSFLFYGDYVTIIPYFELDGKTVQKFITNKTTTGFDRSLAIYQPAIGNWWLTCKDNEGTSSMICQTNSFYTFQLVRQDGTFPTTEELKSMSDLDKAAQMIYQDSIVRFWNPRANSFVDSQINGGASFIQAKNAPDQGPPEGPSSTSLPETFINYPIKYKEKFTQNNCNNLNRSVSCILSVLILGLIIYILLKLFYYKN